MYGCHGIKCNELNEKIIIIKKKATTTTTAKTQMQHKNFRIIDK